MKNQDKSLLRQEYLAIRAGIPAAEKEAWTKEVLDKLFALPAWKDASLIYSYVSVRGEIDTSQIRQRAAEEGKSFALPCTVTGADKGEMVFRLLPPDAPLMTGRFGIPEPHGSCPEVPLDEDAHGLMLLPGLAFDTAGYRIGYGGGYYDRYLQKASAAGVSLVTVALTFSPLVVTSLPHEAHDCPAHIIIDERRVHLIHGQA